MDRISKSLAWIILVGSLLVSGFLSGCRSREPVSLIQVEAPPGPEQLPPAPRREQVFQFMQDSYRSVGDLHTMTLCGDFQQLIDVQHWGIMMELDRQQPPKPPNRHGCSMFQVRLTDGTELVGRNFDHKNSGMLVAWCYPDSGFNSLGFIPLNQWGFTEDNPFDPQNPRHKRQLLSGPVTTIEGLNEMGVTVTLASLDKQQVTPSPDKPGRFLIHLVREILDHASSLEEAISLAQGYNIFDNGRDIITHHIFLGDPVSGSAVLEWHDGQMQVLRSGPETQVVTNTPLFGASSSQVAHQCRRFRTITNALENRSPDFGWPEAMDALQQAAQHNSTFIIAGERWRVSTQWSAIFDLTAREIYLCLGRDYGQVYHLKVPSWRPPPAAGP